MKSDMNSNSILSHFQQLFLTGSLPPKMRSLGEYTHALGRAIQFSMDLCHLLLVRVGEQGEIKEYASWDAPGHAAPPEFFSECLKRHHEIFLKQGLPDDDGMRKILVEMGDPSMLDCHPTAFPILSGERHMEGFAMFGKDGAPWKEEEKDYIRLLMKIISISFVNLGVNEEYALQSWIYNTMMDSMNINIYISDVQTDEILFMNKTMKRVFHIEHPEGEICWKALQNGLDCRCDFCPVQEMLASGKENASCVWEEKNTITGRIYENHDSLMRWSDGRLVHLQQSIDVTESKKLSQAANMDELTQMLNRRAGKRKLQDTLLDAKRKNDLVCVVMCDVNGLKEVNDNYGHGEGDFLLSTVAAAVKQHLLPDAYASRLSGDEFLVVFPHTAERTVQKKMQEMQKALLKVQRQKIKPYPLSFSYGLLEVPPTSMDTLSQILIQVDEKMYEQKRRFHLSQHQNEAVPGMACAEFHYDEEQLYDALVRSTDDYIYLCNMKENRFCFPPSVVEEFDIPGQIVENASILWGELIHPDDRAAFFKAFNDMVAGLTNVHNVEYRIRNRRGEWVWLRCRGYLKRDNQGEPNLFAGIMTNLGKRNKIDHLTGLRNKYQFEDDIQSFLVRNQRDTLGVMILGIDEFKHVNDLYNRMFGDEVIRIIAQKIQFLLPDNAAAYRMDGDEFGILLRGASEDDLYQIYARIHEAVSHQQSYGDKKYYSTLSAGGVLFPRDGDNYLDLVKYAGYSLEYAKNAGKNQMALFSKEILAQKSRHLDLLEHLRESIEENYEGFFLCYQPQVEACSGKVTGAEALSRWHCDKYGAVSPDEFISLLEECGLIVPFGKWVFRRAVEQCSRWIKIHPTFSMSVNLSYLQLTDPEFLPFVRETLMQYELDASHIVLEMTESYIASNIDSLSDVFSEFRQMGIQVAMDDFGTGYSSLSILKRAPADVVKIDRAFVQDIKDSDFDRTFIRFTVELCHDVQIRVCLEGVETQREYDIVKRMKLDYIQGFFFGKPVLAEEFETSYLHKKLEKDIFHSAN